MRKSVSHVFNDIQKESNRNKAMEILRKNMSSDVKWFLLSMYCPVQKADNKFDKLSKPVYVPSDTIEGDHNPLYKSLRRIELLYERSDIVSIEVKQRKFEVICSSIYAKDAELFAKLVLGKLKVKKITEKFVREALPGLLSDKNVES